MTIDYDKMQREFPKQKAALTRALKSGDYAKVVATTKQTIQQWDETGAWPDDWAHWERALDDAWWDAKQRYMRDEISEMPEHQSTDTIRASIAAERSAAARAKARESRGITLSRAQLNEWAGRELTAYEVDRLESALPHSTLPDTIDTIVSNWD